MTDAVKNPNQALWEKGDFTKIASYMRASGEAFVKSLGITPPEGFISPMLLGVEEHIVDRFRQAGVPAVNITMAKDTFHFVAADKSPEVYIEDFRMFYGPTMNAYEAAEKAGRTAELHAQLVQLAKAQNKASDGSTAISATFMRVEVRV